jgi:hypothetical protein
MSQHLVNFLLEKVISIIINYISLLHLFFASSENHMHFHLKLTHNKLPIGVLNLISWQITIKIVNLYYPLSRLVNIWIAGIMVAWQKVIRTNVTSSRWLSSWEGYKNNYHLYFAAAEVLLLHQKITFATYRVY